VLTVKKILESELKEDLLDFIFQVWFDKTIGWLMEGFEFASVMSMDHDGIFNDMVELPRYQKYIDLLLQDKQWKSSKGFHVCPCIAGLETYLDGNDCWPKPKE